MTEHAIAHFVFNTMNLFPSPDMKMKWPELEGKDVEEARQQIQLECPDVRIQILDENSPATMDLRMDRVRIIKNYENKVLIAMRG